MLYYIFSMSRHEVLETLKGLNIPSDRYIVTMGAVLAVNDKREAGDIDIIFDPALAPLLRARGFHYSPKSGESQYKTRYVKGNIEAFTRFFNIGTFKECVSRFGCEHIEGVPFMPLSETLFVKSLFGRDKDFADVQAFSAS